MGRASRTIVDSIATTCLLFIVSLVTAAGLQEPDERSELSRLLSSDNTGFKKATEPRRFVFPADHGPHAGYRTEWWYLTGNLDGDHGRRFGFELTIFRFALSPDPVAPGSAWRSNQIYVAHFAVTDPQGDRFLVAERYSRGALGLAGAQAEPFRVWIDDWEMTEDTDERMGESWRVRASEKEFAIDLAITAAKKPVLNGVDGLSQKSSQAGNASYYYSISRWDTEGLLRLGEEEFAVSGLTWLDREWSSSALGDDQVGWDWFALQLSDGSDLMFYNLRKSDGSQDEHSAGTFVSANGKATHLDRQEVSIDVLDEWPSPEGGRYPSRWRISIPAIDLRLDVEPVMANQELFTTVRYWEGAVDVSGDRDGDPVDGRGYVEMTGYAESVTDQ